MEQNYYSHGKLLISGEYAVLDGALALAVPTRFGQHMAIRENDTGILSWTGVDEEGNIWFKEEYSVNDLRTGQDEASKANQSKPSERLWAILVYARELNPEFLKSNAGCEVETRLEFNRHWGLGSSSTLVSNIAQWAGADAHKLNRHIFGGSGYDIACALSHGPLHYQLLRGEPKVRKVEFNPPFAEHLFFVYLNQKMDSRKAIEQYRKASFDKEKFTESISQQSQIITGCTDLESFMVAITEHEEILSEVLGIPPVKEQLFPDFAGAIKSLGGWGGDFILAASDKTDGDYFLSRDYKTVIPFSEMVL